MFNLLVKSGGWDERFDWLPSDRVFEYTADSLVQQFKPEGALASDLVRSLPAFFIPEVASDEKQQGQVGTITAFRVSRERVGLEYALNSLYPPVPMADIQRLTERLDINRFELRRTHWAVKDVDLLSELALERSDPESSGLYSTAATEEWERQLRQAVELVRATTAVDVQLRAIAIVQNVVEPWVDFGGGACLLRPTNVAGPRSLGRLRSSGCSQSEEYGYPEPP